MEISVVIPAYNEEQSIRLTVDRCVRSLRALFERFEIIIVDDKSTDATPQIADELSSQYPEVRVIHNECNLRQGASLVRGFKEARMNLVTHNAMDYPFDLSNLKQIFPLLERTDVVVGARKSRPDSSIYRRFLTAANLFLLRNCFDLKLKDYNFIQIYRREVLDALEFRETSTGFLIPSLLFQVHRLGYRIDEVLLDYQPRERGEAKSACPRVLVETLWDMFKFWLKYKYNVNRGSIPKPESARIASLQRK